MGADQIGYLSIIPTGSKSKQIVKKRVDELDALFAKHGGKPDSVKEIIAGLNKIGLDTESLLESACCEDEEALVNMVRESVSTVKERATDPSRIDGRDVASRRQKINGVEVSIIFAGEMSWGDDPDGWGYVSLKALDTIGVLEDLEALVPFNKKPKRRK